MQLSIDAYVCASASASAFTPVVSVTCVAATPSGSHVLRDAQAAAQDHVALHGRDDAAPAADDLMRLVYAREAHPTLPKELWGEIALFGAHDDVLQLRAASTGMSRWIDRSFTTLGAHADEAVAMLAGMAVSPNFNHIETVHVWECNVDNLPAVLAAFAAVPHEQIHLMLGTHHDAHSLKTLWPLFRTIAPASLSINFAGAAHHTPITRPESDVLADLHYPLYLGTGIYSEDEEDEGNVRALASIPWLSGLDMSLDGFSVELAQAFKLHPRLRDLRIEDYMDTDLVMSTTALTLLAESTTLKSLHIGNTREVFGEPALRALAANRSLQTLRLGTYDEPFGLAVAEALSTNTTLKQLDIALRAGCGHLAKIPTLEALTLCSIGTEITREDATLFAQHAHLKLLNFSTEVRIRTTGRVGFSGQWRFEAGALAILASSHVEQLVMPAAEWTSKEVDAILANRTLRILICGIVDKGPDARGDIIEVARRLAGHPTLASLSITFVSPWYMRSVPAHNRITHDERASVFEAWGTQRSANDLQLRGFKERELTTQHYRIEPFSTHGVSLNRG